MRKRQIANAERQRLEQDQKTREKEPESKTQLPIKKDSGADSSGNYADGSFRNEFLARLRKYPVDTIIAAGMMIFVPIALLLLAVKAFAYFFGISLPSWL